MSATTFRNLRQKVILFWALIVVVAAGITSMQASEAKAPPNIIFVVIDDLNHDLGYLGADYVRTPQIDALAKKGVAFTNAYAQSPLCNPSRTSILSGLRPETHRVVDNFTPPQFHLPEIQFFPEYFRQHGWTTFGVGKTTQMGQSEVVNERSFDRYLRLGHSKRNRQAREQGEVSVVGGRFQIYEGNEALITDAVRTRTFVKELESLAQGDKPFLAYLGFNLSHFGGMLPQRVYDQFSLEAVPPLPDEPAGHLDGLRSYQGGEVSVPPTEERRQEVLRDRQAYYAAISYVDELMGSIFTEMDRLQLWETTAVVVVSDHGMLMGQHGGQVGKGNLMRETVRVPLIVYAPGEAGNGQTCEQVVELIDIYPTLTQLAGLATPTGLEGRSLVPLLNNPKAKWDQVALSTHLRGRFLGQAVTTDKWRYIQWEGADIQQLYQIRDDPKEYLNLATQPGYEDTIAELQQHFVQAKVPLKRRDKQKSQRK